MKVNVTDRSGRYNSNVTETVHLLYILQAQGKKSCYASINKWKDNLSQNTK